MKILNNINQATITKKDLFNKLENHHKNYSKTRIIDSSKKEILKLKENF